MSHTRFPLLLLLSVVVGCGGIKTGAATDSGDAPDLDGDGSPAGEDCDDDNAAVFPGNPEICDGIDNDCNAQVDEDDPGLVDGVVYYPDLDGDGYGDDAAGEVACAAPSNAVAEGGDCDDANADANPGGTEDCLTAADDDCSGSPNDVDALNCSTWYTDADGDDHGAVGADSACLCFPDDTYLAPVADDCDDADDSVNPDEAEVCNDGIDNNCDDGWDECRHSRMAPVSERGVELYGLTEDSMVGSMLSMDGDITGDGRADLVVSAPGDSSGAGLIYIISGAPTAGTTLANAADAVIEPDVASQVVQAVIGGDMDGDGNADLVLVGSTPYDNHSELSVFAGPITGDVDPGDAILRVSPFEELDLWGDVVVGDWDGDSKDEALVLTRDGTGFSGFDNLAGPTALLHGDAGGYVSAADIGDVDGDGDDDLLFANPNTGAGAVGLWQADGATPTDIATEVTSLAGEDDGDLAGQTIAPAGDLNADGYADFLIGAPYHETDEYRQGVVYVFEGGAALSPSGLTDASFELVGKLRNDHAGMGAAGLGDMDGDGHADLAVASTGWDTASYNNAGTVYFVHGPFAGSVALTDERGRVEGGHSSGMLGSTMVGNADLDGDGFMDMVMAELGNDTGASDAGAVWLMYGQGL